MYFTPNDKIFEILNLGFTYIHGRDHQFRPVIVCQPYIYVQHENEFSYDDWMRSTVFICEYAANHMLIPGQIENWVMITNSRHVSMLFLPSEMKKVINVMSDNYRSKLYINYIIGMSRTLRILFSIVCKFLDEMTVKKLVVIDDIHDGTMTKQIRRDNIEEKFGGTAKDLIPGKDNLFPPAMPKTKCLLDNEKERQTERIKEEKKQEQCKDINYMLKEKEWNVQDEFDYSSCETKHTSLHSVSYPLVR